MTNSTSDSPFNIEDSKDYELEQLFKCSVGENPEATDYIQSEVLLTDTEIDSLVNQALEYQQDTANQTNFNDDFSNLMDNKFKRENVNSESQNGTNDEAALPNDDLNATNDVSRTAAQTNPDLNSNVNSTNIENVYDILLESTSLSQRQAFQNQPTSSLFKSLAFDKKKVTLSPDHQREQWKLLKFYRKQQNSLKSQVSSLMQKQDLLDLQHCQLQKIHAQNLVTFRSGNLTPQMIAQLNDENAQLQRFRSNYEKVQNKRLRFGQKAKNLTESYKFESQKLAHHQLQDPHYQENNQTSQRNIYSASILFRSQSEIQAPQQIRNLQAYQQRQECHQRMKNSPHYHQWMKMQILKASKKHRAQEQMITMQTGQRSQMQNQPLLNLPQDQHKYQMVMQNFEETKQVGQQPNQQLVPQLIQQYQPFQQLYQNRQQQIAQQQYQRNLRQQRLVQQQLSNTNLGQSQLYQRPNAISALSQKDQCSNKQSQNPLNFQVDTVYHNHRMAHQAEKVNKINPELSLKLKRRRWIQLLLEHAESGHF